MNYNELTKKAHDNAVQKGFWKDQLSESHCLMLVFTEISEAVEADRKGMYADLKSYINRTPDISFNGLKTKGSVSDIAFQMKFEKCIKDSVADELADAAIRLFDYAGYLQIDFNKLPTCKYYRAFNRFSFTENAFGLTKGLAKEAICIEKRIQFGLNYLKEWADHLQIDLEFHVKEKMKYNEGREAMHGKKY